MSSYNTRSIINAYFYREPERSLERPEIVGYKTALIRGELVNVTVYASNVPKSYPKYANRSADPGVAKYSQWANDQTDDFW